jgi:hypothetical protein
MAALYFGGSVREDASAEVPQVVPKQAPATAGG